jgi:DNA (cytosine-5)-methyltransferase 1
VVRRCKPLVFVAENVYGLLTMKGVIETITRDFADCGYTVEYQLVKCEEHGIPQTRWRTIILGVRSDKQHLLDEDWHRITENRVRCPVGAYIGHLSEPKQTTDPAQQVYSKASRLEKGQGQKEIVLTRCAPTIRAEHHGNIEFRRVVGGDNKEAHLQERRLTLREAALIQTFPPDCILTEPEKKKTMVAYKPIGNAVPPLLSYLIARKVCSILKKIN